jgi:hypothetical protein
MRKITQMPLSNARRVVGSASLSGRISEQHDQPATARQEQDEDVVGVAVVRTWLRLAVIWRLLPSSLGQP